MEINRSALPTKLLWVDLEMTGLDSDHDVILEIAAKVTGFDFKTIASFERIVYQSDEVLARMTEWPRRQHAASGLTERVRTAGQPEDTVKHEFAAFIQEQFGNEPAILAGNSIHNDRLFIRRWWPEVDALLHYRMLDVSSLKIIMQGKYAVQFEKNDSHRALEDIQASIAELQYYLDWLRQGMG
jgi:oligoribonuclease